MRLFVVTWSESSEDFILKEIDQVTLPQFPREKNWRLHNQIEENLHNLAVYYRVNKDYALKYAKWISENTSSFNLSYKDGFMEMISHTPKLDFINKTFPKLYYKFKHLENVIKRIFLFFF